MPYAPLICCGVYPHGEYGRSPAPYGFVDPVAVFSPQYTEHGVPVTKAGAGGASLPAWSACTNCALSSSPITPSTVPARSLGMESSEDGERTVRRCTRYMLNVVP